MTSLTVGRVLRSSVSGKTYRVGALLGAGGFGRVYEAFEADRRGRQVGKPVCIKVTPDQASWHREAYFGELLRGNKRVIQLFESFPYQTAGKGRRPIYCLILERAKHRALADRLRVTRTPWSESSATREIIALLRVLDELHGGGALHRDLTPFNIFVCAGGVLKLGDFGIARHGKIGKGVPAGTFNWGWAPPGIVEGEQQRWLEQDDIYQMGQLLAALVKGQISVISTGDVRQLSCSNSLKAVIRRAVGQRHERYRDAVEMIAAIQSPRTAETGGVSTLKGKTVVFTGPLSMRRRKAEELVRGVGGKVSDVVRTATDVLVRGAQSSRWLAGDQGKKLIDALRLQERGANIRVINERQFQRLVRRR